MPVLTRRLAVLMALGALGQLAVAIVSPQRAGLLLTGWVAAVVVLSTFDFIRAPNPDLIGFVRELPAVATIGEPAKLRWLLSNPSDRSVRVAVADDLTPSMCATSRRASVDLPAKATAEIDVAFEPSRRGLFRLSEVVIRVEGPLGIMARQAARTAPGEMRVHPRFRSRKEAELRINRARLLHAGVRSTRLHGAGTDFDQLREYTVDDDSRRVDWAATARVGRPIVRTFRAERNQTVVNLLDSGRVMAGQVEGVPRLEHAMDAVLTLTAVSTGIGDRCGLVVFDRSVHTVLAAVGRRSQLGAVSSALFDIEPALVESDYQGAFASTLARFRRRAMLVIHTDLVDQVVAETLIPAMPLVVKTHLVVVAASSDPEVVRWSTADATDGDEVRRRAAAISSLNERRSTAAHLRGLGATVVDAPVGELPAILADTYLKAKSTGRL